MTAETDHSGSILLTHDENEQIYRLLGSRCQTLATAVVQLFVTDPPNHSAWRQSDAGVLCLVKDNQRCSYFFRLYCLIRCEMVWEHEVYNTMDYHCPEMWLHTFEGEHCIVAFNFAHEDEARNIRIVIDQQLEAKKQRRMERRSTLSMQPSHNSVSSHPVIPGGSVTGSHLGTSSYLVNGSLVQSPRQQHHTVSGGKKKDKDSKRRLTKADIGQPNDFRHIVHVGWDPNKGFAVDIEDPQLKLFFVKAGVSDKELQNRETREFIYDFISTHGGMEAVKDEVVYHQAPQPPVGPPPVPARSAPVNNFQHQARSAPPPLPHRTNAHPLPPPPAPPPPPPSQPPLVTGLPPPPPPPTRTPVQRQDMAPSQVSGVPTPPPPPPALPAVCAPPPLPPPMPLPSVDSNGQSALGADDPRSALLESVCIGKTLKHVEVDNKRPASVGDSRGELLDQIRQGIELKSVQITPRPTVNAAPDDSLSGALARALEERARAIYSSGSSGEDDGDDEEWNE